MLSACAMFTPDLLMFESSASQFYRLMIQSTGWIAISNGPLRKGMKYIFIVLAMLAVAGCAATSKPVKQSKRGIHINCSGLTSSWAKCYELATNACASRTFKVIAKSGDATEEPEDYPFGLNPAGYTSRSMIIVCRKSTPLTDPLPQD
ncbi:hypothetical protein ALP98_03072 [Pseudomonas viridiflava]|uniref:Lipoprotein n=2 Tax=Pseudomonas syringae group TaxID=136849 RepID=A0A3M4PBJ0_PSEVI|nr:hypothetical protein ALP98_03072 [Pseudomonas viridiflava]RMR60429.1 hypothetical protein ALP83_01214 [Pseudomonas syringae pv. actinidiae]